MCLAIFFPEEAGAVGEIGGVLKCMIHRIPFDSGMKRKPMNHNAISTVFMYLVSEKANNLFCNRLER